MHILQCEFSTYGVQCGRMFSGTSFHRTLNLACTVWTLQCDRFRTSKIKHQSIKLRRDLACNLSLSGSECVEGTNIVEEGMLPDRILSAILNQDYHLPRFH